jgi:hypothetical protein
MPFQETGGEKGDLRPEIVKQREDGQHPEDEPEAALAN